MHVEAAEMASLEEQQPKRVRARTQQLQRKQERSALAGSALGGACGWEDSPGVALGVEVREERGCEDRRAGGLG